MIKTYFLVSSHWPARKFRQWAQGREDLNRDMMSLQYAISWVVCILVFLLMGVAGAVHNPQQVGLP